MNTEIRKRTEITGFVDVITRTPERTAPNATKSSRKLFMTILIDGPRPQTTLLSHSLLKSH